MALRARDWKVMHTRLLVGGWENLEGTHRGQREENAPLWEEEDGG